MDTYIFISIYLCQSLLSLKVPIIVYCNLFSFVQISITHHLSLLNVIPLSVILSIHISSLSLSLGFLVFRLQNLNKKSPFTAGRSFSTPHLFLLLNVLILLYVCSEDFLSVSFFYLFILYILLLSTFQPFTIASLTETEDPLTLSADCETLSCFIMNCANFTLGCFIT